MIANIFSSLAMKVAGGICAALLLALAVQTWRASQWQQEAREAQKEVGAVTQRLVTSNASIERLEATIAQMNDEAQKRADELERSKKLAAQQDARFDKMAKANERRIDQLKEMAENLSSDCRVPDEMLAAVRGL